MRVLVILYEYTVYSNLMLTTTKVWTHYSDLLDKLNIIIFLNRVDMNSFLKLGNVKLDIITIFSMLNTICNLPMITEIFQLIRIQGTFIRSGIIPHGAYLTILQFPSLQYPTDPKPLTIGKKNISRRRTIECDLCEKPESFVK